MSDPMQNLNEAADALNQVAERAGGFWDDADARVAAKEAQVDAFVAGAKGNFRSHPDLVFDNTIVHSKTSLSVTADPTENSRSEWQVLDAQRPDSYMTCYENGFASIYLMRCYSSAPGYYQNPQYGTDWSRTMVNFVLASHNATSAEIDARLGELGAAPANRGSWGPVIQYGSIPIVRPAGRAAEMKLWVRLINISQVAGNEPQEITNFGDPTGFVVDRVSAYNPL